MVMVDPTKTLDDVQRVAVRMSDAVNPGLVIEIHSVSDQRVSVPMPDRVAHPQRAESRVMRAAIRVNRMPQGVVLEKDDDFAGHLHNLHREGMKVNPRQS